MKKYYEKYYAALDFFREKTLSVEINFSGRLTKIRFPKIPLCDKVTERSIDKFKQQAVRISQE